MLRINRDYWPKTSTVPFVAVQTRFAISIVGPVLLFVLYCIFVYLGTTLTNQNSIAEEIKSRLRSGNACYHSVQNLLSSRLLSKNLKIKIYRTIILPVLLYGC